MHNSKTISLVGYASGVAAGDKGCCDGPTVLQQSNLIPELAKQGLNAKWLEVFSPLKGSALTVVTDICKRVAQKTCALTQQDSPFVVVGGDHSSAIGTWSGVRSALSADSELGLIWFDAHLDAHTPETTETGNIHGMPVASLLGYGSPELINIQYKGAKIRPENLCLIGIRSFEKGEEKLIKDLGVRVYYMDEVKQRGIKVILKEVVTNMNHNTVGYGLSIDLDGIDPLEAPGVGTPVPDGISANELCQALAESVRNDHHLLGVEITEYNPHHDINNRTQDIIKHLLLSIFK